MPVRPDRFFFQPGPDVHAGRVVPDKEGFVGSSWARSMKSIGRGVEGLWSTVSMRLLGQWVPVSSTRPSCVGVDDTAGTELLVEFFGSFG
jgi:hypothetical protein